MIKQKQEYNELQEYIDTIITTANLIGYKVLLNDSKTIIHIKKRNGIFSYITIQLIPNTTTLKTTYKGESKKFNHSSPHQTKMEDLQNILHSL